MTKNKMLNKLGNAIRAKRGVSWNRAPADRPRKDQATQRRIEKWYARCTEKGAL